MSQSIMVACARGIVVQLQTDAVKRVDIFSCKKYEELPRSLRSIDTGSARNNATERLPVEFFVFRTFRGSLH